MYIELVAISAENYKEICKENLTGQNNDRLSVSFPDDIELVEVNTWNFIDSSEIINSL